MQARGVTPYPKNGEIVIARDGERGIVTDVHTMGHTFSVSWGGRNAVVHTIEQFQDNIIRKALPWE